MSHRVVNRPLDLHHNLAPSLSDWTVAYRPRADIGKSFMFIPAQVEKDKTSHFSVSEMKFSLVSPKILLMTFNNAFVDTLTLYLGECCCIHLDICG